jgi:O-antigen ligase
MNFFGLSSKPPVDALGLHWWAVVIWIAIASAAVATKLSGFAFWTVLLVGLGGLVFQRNWVRLPLWMPVALIAPLVIEIGNAWWFNAPFSSINLFVLLAIPVLAVSTQCNPRLIVHATASAAAAGAIAALVMALAVKILTGADRAATPGMNELLFAVIALLLATICAVAWLQAARNEVAPWLRSLCIVGCLAGVAAASLSGSRVTGLGCLLIATMVFRSLHKRLDLSWPKKAALAGSVAFGLAVVLMTTSTGERLRQTAAELRTWNRAEALGSSTQERLRLAWAAGLVIQESPWIGIGPGAFPLAVEALKSRGQLPQTTQAYRHPHLTYLTVLVESGVIGLASWLALLVAVLYQFWRTSGLCARIGTWTVGQCLVLSLGTDLQAHQGSLRLMALVLGLCLAGAMAKPLASRPSLQRP